MQQGRVSVIIEVHSRTVAAVQRAFGDNSQALLAFLRQGRTERFRTDAVIVEPQSETDRHGLPDRIVGYNGTLTVSF